MDKTSETDESQKGRARELVQERFRLDEEKKNLEDRLKEIKQERKAIDRELIDVMAGMDISKLHSQRGTLKLVERETKAPIERDHLQQALSEYLPQEQNDAIVDRMESLREARMQQYLMFSKNSK